MNRLYYNVGVKKPLMRVFFKKSHVFGQKQRFRIKNDIKSLKNIKNDSVAKYFSENNVKSSLH